MTTDYAARIAEIDEYAVQLRQGLIDPQAELGGRREGVSLHVIHVQLEAAERVAAPELAIRLVAPAVDAGERAAQILGRAQGAPPGTGW